MINFHLVETWTCFLGENFNNTPPLGKLPMRIYVKVQMCLVWINEDIVGQQREHIRAGGLNIDLNILREC